MSFRRGGAGLAAIAAVVLLASGCGYGAPATAASHPDVHNGQVLFTQKCGGCHTLQAAGTSGTVGPNLDNAFAGPRIEGYADSSIANVVLDQIRLGSGSVSIPYTTGKEFTSPKCLDPATRASCNTTPMPKDVVSGQDAIDVATYVGTVAGVGGFTSSVNLASLTSGADIFKLGPCASCHALKAAGTTGNPNGQGPPPNLDAIASQLTLAKIVTQVTNGGTYMPAFGTQLTKAQIDAVAQYVLSVAGKK